jgi:hypothetical protein
MWTKEKKYDRVSTSCGLEDDDGPEPVEAPSRVTLLLQQCEALFCPCAVNKSQLRQRNFDAVVLPRLSKGSILILQSYNPVIPRSSNPIAKVTSGLLNFFTSSAAPPQPSIDDNHTSTSIEAAKTLIGRPVLVSANRDLLLRFKMTANQTTTRGSVHFSNIHHVKALQEEQRCFACMTSDGNEVIRFQADSTALRDQWVEDLCDVLMLWADDIEQTIGKSEKENRRKERQIEIAERRKLAKARIAAFDLQGMKNSAIARSTRN